MNSTKQNTYINIEKYGLESVPKVLRKTKWYEYTMIQAAFSVNAGNFLVPAFAVLHGGLSIFHAILSTIIGAAIAFLLVSFLSIPGAKHGIPAQFAIRSFLGLKGAQFISSPVRTITSMYWFSVQTIGGSIVLKDMLFRYYQIEVPFLIIVLVLGSIMALLAMVGFDALKKTIKNLFPILLIGQAVILYLFLKEVSSSEQMNLYHNDSSLSMMIFYASLAFVQYVSGVSSASDVTRYAVSYKQGFFGLFSGNMIGFFMTAVLGAMSAGLFENVNPYVVSSALTDSKWLIFIIFINAMLSMISINLNNAYTGGFSLLNMLPALGRVKASILFGVTAVLLSTFPNLVHEAKDYISLLGSLIIPLSAVIVVDFVWIKRRNLLDGLQIEDFNRVGFINIVLGILIYFMIPEALSPGFVTFVVVSFSYYVSSKLFVKRKNVNSAKM